MPTHITDARALITCGWDDVPHLDAKTKKELLDSTPEYLRDARSKGTPSLGAGAIYPIPESDIRCDPFQIPSFWRRAYGMDVGWNKTAAIWGAEDPADKTIYLYAEHYRGKEIPLIHAAAIRARGKWIRGAIDPASRGRSQEDGKRLFETYTNAEHGLNLVPARNEVDAGIYECWSRFQTNRLRVFSTLSNFWAEYRLYRRDEDGKIVKEKDHMMDAKRYLVLNFNAVARVEPPKLQGGGGAHVPADRLTGY